MLQNVNRKQEIYTEQEEVCRMLERRFVQGLLLFGFGFGWTVLSMGSMIVTHSNLVLVTVSLTAT